LALRLFPTLLALLWAPPTPSSGSCQRYCFPLGVLFPYTLSRVGLPSS